MKRLLILQLVTTVLIAACDSPEKCFPELTHIPLSQFYNPLPENAYGVRVYPIIDKNQSCNVLFIGIDQNGRELNSVGVNPTPYMMYDSNSSSTSPPVQLTKAQAQQLILQYKDKFGHSFVSEFYTIHLEEFFNNPSLYDGFEVRFYRTYLGEDVNGNFSIQPYINGSGANPELLGNIIVGKPCPNQCWGVTSLYLVNSN